VAWGTGGADGGHGSADARLKAAAPASLAGAAQIILVPCPCVPSPLHCMQPSNTRTVRTHALRLKQVRRASLLNDSVGEAERVQDLRSEAKH
jgi:alpha-D-ribose 1-methylphosphonate 5-phosphate C-P lyase